VNAETSSVLDTSAVVGGGDTPWTTSYAAALREESDVTVHEVSTGAAAREKLRETTVDCVVTDDGLAGTTGVDLVRRIRDASASLPVILGTADGSERPASEAIEAGVTDYVAVTDSSDDAVSDALRRTERALRRAQRSATQRERARQFASSTTPGPRRGCSTPTGR